MRRLIIFIVILILVLGAMSALQKYAPAFSNFIQDSKIALPQTDEKIKIVSEESVTIDIVKKAGPSVVTVSSEAVPQASNPYFDFGPFFDIPGGGDTSPGQPQDIGSGFIVSTDGMIITNKHVVSETGAKYQIVTSNDKKYTVSKIYRDPLNDIAILKIDPGENSGAELKPIELGESSNLQVGQYVAAIGTALGEFRNTVTTGIISGLGRGITAGSPYAGFVERLDNVIQTSAAINPGNSGGPLLNSKGQVIGINTAVSGSGQNIGFAIPINIIKDSLKNFNATGQFNRPYLGIAYKMISKDIALLNNLPEGAYVQNVIQDSASDKAGVKRGDIIVKIDDQRVDSAHQLSALIAKRKVGDSIKITYYRDSSTHDTEATLDSAPSQ